MFQIGMHGFVFEIWQFILLSCIKLGKLHIGRDLQSEEISLLDKAFKKKIVEMENFDILY